MPWGPLLETEDSKSDGDNLRGINYPASIKSRQLGQPIYQAQRMMHKIVVALQSVSCKVNQGAFGRETSCVLFQS